MILKLTNVKQAKIEQVGLEGICNSNVAANLLDEYLNVVKEVVKDVNDGVWLFFMLDDSSFNF